MPGGVGEGLDGDADAAAAMDEHLAEMAGIDAHTMHHFLLGLKADVLAGHGRARGGSGALDCGAPESTSAARRTWRPELLRRRGELLLTAGRRDEAVAALQLAEETAAAQGALALELRALESLAAGAAMGG